MMTAPPRGRIFTHTENANNAFLSLFSLTPDTFYWFISSKPLSLCCITPCFEIEFEIRLNLVPSCVPTEHLLIVAARQPEEALGSRQDQAQYAAAMALHVKRTHYYIN